MTPTATMMLIATDSFIDSARFLARNTKGRLIATLAIDAATAPVAATPKEMTALDERLAAAATALALDTAPPIALTT